MPSKTTKKRTMQLDETPSRPRHNRLRVGEPRRTFYKLDPGALKVLRPSVPAEELAALLGLTADFLVQIKHAGVPFKFALTEEDARIIAAISNDRRNTPSPSLRLEQAKAYRAKLHSDRLEAWHQIRSVVLAWVGLVQAYAIQRPAFEAMATVEQRAEAAERIRAEYEQFGRAGAIALAHQRIIAFRIRQRGDISERTQYRIDLRIDQKRKRAAFGYRRGRGGSGFQPGARKWITHPSGGDWHAEQAKAATSHAEMLLLGNQVGSGFYIVKDENYEADRRLMRKCDRAAAKASPKLKEELQHARDEWRAGRDDGELEELLNKPKKGKRK